MLKTIKYFHQKAFMGCIKLLNEQRWPQKTPSLEKYIFYDFLLLPYTLQLNKP